MESFLSSTIRFIATSAAVTVLVLVQLSAANSLDLANRQPWMDEVHTLELVGDPDTNHMLGALADGADFNPPGYFFVARFVTGLTDTSDTVVLRSFSLLCIIAGLVAIALSLQRQVHFAVALTVVAGLFAQTLLVDQGLEARFYAPWFAALAWFCWCVEKHNKETKSKSKLTIAFASVLAIIVCSLHYFGVISLLLVVAGLIIRDPKSSLRTHIWLPAILGCAAIACCYPFYVGQRAALSVPTWISPPDVEHIQRFLARLIPAGVAALAVFAAIGSGLLAKVSSPFEKDQDPKHDWSPLKMFAGSSCLLLFPFVLIAFSYTIQPALVPRYSLVFFIGCAPVLGWLLHHVRWQMLVPVAACCLAMGVFRTHNLRKQFVQLDRSRTELIETLDNVAVTQPVAFENRIDSFPLMWLAGHRKKNWYLVDFEDHSLKEPSAIRIVQRDVARRFALWYPRYKTTKIEELALRNEFYIVPYPARSTDDIEYGPYRSEQVADRLYKMSRTQMSSLPQP